MPDHKRPSLRRRILFLGIGLGMAAGFALIGTELFLRGIRSPTRFFPYPPQMIQAFYPSEEAMPGVSGASYFSTNTQGLRGPEFGDEGLRILAVGGSTTVDTFLDDSETWTELTRRALNEARGDDNRAWVGTGAIDGQNSHHHIMHAKYLLPLLPRIDYVTYYAGLNDVGVWLYDQNYDPNALANPEYWNRRIGESFKVSNYIGSLAGHRWFHRFEIWRQADLAKTRLETRFLKEQRATGAVPVDAHGKWLDTMRDKRADSVAPVLHGKLESLPAALESYERNLRDIVKLTRAAKSEPIFIAQAIQSLFLSEDEKEQLWMGAVDGGDSYASEEQMLQFVKAHNDVMKTVASEMNVHFLDLPERLLGYEEVGGLFYDGVHFSELGARVMAKELTAFLRTQVLERGAHAGQDPRTP